MNELIYKKSKIKMKRRRKSEEKMEMIQRMCVEALNCYETSKKAFSKDPSELNNSRLQSSIKVIRRLQAKMTQELEKSQLQSETNILKYNTIIKDNIFNNSNNATLRNNFTSNTYSHSNSNVTMEKDRKRKQKQCRVFSGIPECPADNESYAVYSLNHSSTIRDFISSSSYNDANKSNNNTTNARKRAKSIAVKKLNGNKDSDDDNREEDDDDKLGVNDKYESISMSHGDINFETTPSNIKQQARHQKQPFNQQKSKLQRLKYHIDLEAEDEVDYTDQLPIQKGQQNHQHYNFENHQQLSPQQSQQQQINSPNASIIAMDDYEFRFEDNTAWEQPDPRFDDVERLCEHVTHVVVLMNYLLSNSQPASLFLVLLTNKTKKITKKDSSTYLYSIYCLFLQSQAPLKVEVNADVIEAVETLLLDSTPDKIRQSKALEMLEEINSAAKPSLIKSMEEFRSLRQLGMGCMFGEEEILEGNESQQQRNKTVSKLLWPHFQQLSSEISEYSMCVTSCLDAFFKIINFTPPSLSSAKSSTTLSFTLTAASSLTSQPPSQQQPVALPTTRSAPITPLDILTPSTPATAFIPNLPAERCTFPPLPNKNCRTSSLPSLFSSTSSFFSSQSSSQALSFSFLKFCSVLKEKSKIKISLWKDHYLKTSTYTTPCHCHQCKQLVCSVGNYGVQCQKCHKNFHVTCLEKIEERCGYEKFQKISNSKVSGLGQKSSNVANGSKDKKNKFKDAKKNKRFQSLDYEFATIHDKLKTEKTGNLKLMSNTHFISMKHLDGIEPRLRREADLRSIKGNTSPEYIEDYDDDDDVDCNDENDDHGLLKNTFSATTISNRDQIKQNISSKDVNFNENGVDKNNYLLTNNTDNNDNVKRNICSDSSFDNVDAGKPHKQEHDNLLGKDERVTERKNEEENDDDLDLDLDNLDTAVFVPVPYPMKELQSTETPILKKLSSILVQQTQQHMKDKEKRPSQRQAQSDIKELKKLHAINELVNTQQTHLKFLKKLHNIFFVPMYHNNEPDFVYLLFPNLEEVIAIHESLMNEFNSLEEVGGAELVWRLGHILNKQFSCEAGDHCKKVFATFIRKQPLALEVLKSVLRKNEKFAAFMKKATENPLCSRLTLKDMLPYVMQRITKYPLLIDNIVKLMESTSSSPACTEVYRNVFSSVKEIASHVNQAVMEFEGVYKLTALQSLFIKKPINHLTRHAYLPYVDLYKKFDFTEHKHVFDGPLTWFISPTQQNDLHCVLMQDLLVLLHKQRQPTKDKETSASIAILGDLSSPNSTIMSDKNAHNAGGYYNVRSMAKNKHKATNYITNLVLTYQSVIGGNNNSNKNNDNHYHVSRLLPNETNSKKYGNSKTNNSNSQANSGNKKMNVMIGDETSDVVTKHSPVLKITDVMIKPVHEEPCMFYLVCKSDLVSQVYTMVASSQEEKNAWCKRITQTRQVYEENVVYNASFYYGFDGKSKKEDAMEERKSGGNKNNNNNNKIQNNINKDDYLKNSLKSEEKGNVSRVRDDGGPTSITVNNNKNNLNKKHVDNNNNNDDKFDGIEIIVPSTTKTLGSKTPINFEDNNLEGNNNKTSNNVNNNNNKDNNNRDDIEGDSQTITGDERDRVEIKKNNKKVGNKNNGAVRESKFDHSMTISLDEMLHEFNHFVAALDTIVTKEDKDEGVYKKEEKQKKQLNDNEERDKLINKTKKTYKINPDSNCNDLVSTKDLLEWSNKLKDQFKSLMIKKHSSKRHVMNFTDPNPLYN